MKNELIIEGFNLNILNKKNISEIISKTIEIYPNQKNALKNTFKDFDRSSADQIEELAELIILINDGDLINLVENYVWLCNELRVDQFIFKKSGKYRLQSDKDVFREIYNNEPYMSKYINGLILTHLFWSNHLNSYLHFNNFILKNSNKKSYLEIGPGHGLYLSKIFMSESIKNIEAWDISSESLKLTNKITKKIAIKGDFILRNKNIGGDLEDNYSKNFDLIVMVETLECMKKPKKALRNVYKLLSDNGLFYLNFPINAPAPDNLYLLKNIEEVKDLLKDEGFLIKSCLQYPSAGYSLEKAIELGITITCILIASK